MDANCLEWSFYPKNRIKEKNPLCDMLLFNNVLKLRTKKVPMHLENSIITGIKIA